MLQDVYENTAVLSVTRTTASAPGRNIESSAIKSSRATEGDAYSVDNGKDTFEMQNLNTGGVRSDDATTTGGDMTPRGPSTELEVRFPLNNDVCDT